MANIIKALLPSGKAPSVLKAEIIELIETEAPAPDLSAYPTSSQVAEAYATKEELEASTPTREEVIQAVGYHLVVGAEAPPSTMYGVPVIWIDTRDTGAWVAAAPTIDDVQKRVVIPADEGATYRVNGELKEPGSYPYTPASEPTRIVVTATAKEGYVLAGLTRWEGYITEGWAELGVDTLTSGAWANGRPAFGGTWSSMVSPENATISGEGLSVPTFGAQTSGMVRLAGGKIAMRGSVDYDLSTATRNGGVTMNLGVYTTKFSNTDSSLLVVTVVRPTSSSSTSELTIIGTAFPSDHVSDPTKWEGKDRTAFPLKGTLTVEISGERASIFAGGELYGTAILPAGTKATANFIGLRLAGTSGSAKNFSAAVK